MSALVPTADRAYFAAFLDLKGKPALVAGGGAVAALKAETLLRSGARVTVVAPELCARLAELTLLGSVRHEAKRFQPNRGEDGRRDPTDLPRMPGRARGGHRTSRQHPR